MSRRCQNRILGYFLTDSDLDPYRPLKDAFGRFATGITIATCPIGNSKKTGTFAAITVNSFTSVSLEPPLVLWCLESRASTFDAFMASDCYGITVLHSGQRAASERFANFNQRPLTESDYEIWETGAPILTDRLAGFDCSVVDRHRSGDHMILVAEVKKFDARSGKPLMYFASSYAEGPPTE